uniref:Uncharacterized protein n=1 Tax=Triticum urartu TaxID=4572 RepID=A0A8R7V5Y1_TRIUA
ILFTATVIFLLPPRLKRGHLLHHTISSRSFILSSALPHICSVPFLHGSHCHIKLQRSPCRTRGATAPATHGLPILQQWHGSVLGIPHKHQSRQAIQQV